MGGVSPQPSYVIGSSGQVNDLTEAERKHLDAAPWVFTVNSFLSHWEIAGFRPSAWIFGDNNRSDLVDEAALELSVIANDVLLIQRLRHVFLAVEEYEREIRQAAMDWGIPAKFFRRGQPWAKGQVLADSLDGRIYHYGSTLTNAVNLAAILNPGGEIRLFGCEYAFNSDHFWQPERWWHPHSKEQAFWIKVKQTLWRGYRSLYDNGVPLLDCCRSHTDLPAELRLPTGNLLD